MFLPQIAQQAEGHCRDCDRRSLSPQSSWAQRERNRSGGLQSVNLSRLKPALRPDNKESRPGVALQHRFQPGAGFLLIRHQDLVKLAGHRGQFAKLGCRVNHRQHGPG